MPMQVVSKDKVCTVKASINDEEVDREDDCQDVDYQVVIHLCEKRPTLLQPGSMVDVQQICREP